MPVAQAHLCKKTSIPRPRASTISTPDRSSASVGACDSATPSTSDCPNVGAVLYQTYPVTMNPIDLIRTVAGIVLGHWPSCRLPTSTLKRGVVSAVVAGEITCPVDV